MSGYLIDLVLSVRGRVTRREWLLSTLCLVIVVAAGYWLFNNDNFDESVNAVSNAPTMATFLWIALGLFVFTALSVKRLRDGAGAVWLAHTIWIPGAVALVAWGSGVFSDTSATALAPFALAGLSVIAVPAIARCAVTPTGARA